MSEEAAVSLYLDLEEGQIPDIEVVARAALAFSAAIKALAAELAPEADVRVELVSGTEGSLSLNSLIRGAGLLVTKERLVAVALGIMTHIGLEVSGYGISELLDHLTGKDEPAEVQLSEEDIQRIAKAVQGGAGQRQVQEVFKEVERDPAIKGVGATSSPGQRPAVIVPRSQFQERAGLTIREETVSHRIVPQRITVVLVSPVLVEGTRRWKFRGPVGEFGASVKDADFIHRVLTGTTAIPMVAGIIMDVEVEHSETLRDGVWVVDSRAVTRVYDLKPPVSIEQASLFAADAGGQHENDDD